MTVFTYSKARQNFASLLDIARREGEVRIRRKDGSLLTLAPVRAEKKSPLDVQGVKTGATTKDIIEAIHDSRMRG